jgi:hypothetical protein
MRTVHRCHSAFLPVENRSTDYRPISTAAPWPIRPGEDGPLRQTWAMDQPSITAAGAIDTFLVLLIVIGPKLALVPFLEITAPLDDATKRRVQRKMLTTAATVAVLLMVLGELLRTLLHFTIGSLSIAGGVILLVLAVWMVLGPPSGDSHRTAGKDRCKSGCTHALSCLLIRTNQPSSALPTSFPRPPLPTDGALRSGTGRASGW